MEPERGATLSWRGDPSVVGGPTTLRDASARYELREELGRGGMAVVHAAFDRELGRRVALKLLLPERIGSGVLEAQTLAQLRHPNVVMVLDIGTLEDRVFLAMELVEGASLRKWLTTERPWRDIVHMFVGAGQGLAAAHDEGIVHRDFKLDNVLVDRTGSARVADFGLARLGEATEPTGVLVGTLPYLAPELLAGKPGDARSDQFAFGVALAEALGGKRPFASTDRETLAAAHARGPQLDAIERTHLRAIVARSLAIDPAERFPSMHELVAALDHDPTVRRRRFAIGGAVFAVGAVAASAVALQMRSHDAGPSCSVPRPLDGIWDAHAHDAWRAAIARSKAPYAVKTGETIEHDLDAYARTLQLNESAACEAVGRGGETHELSNARAACLSRARNALGQLTSVLTTTDDGMLARAPLAVAQLPDPNECADAALLLRPDRLPNDPMTLARIMTVRADVDQAMMLRHLGKPRDAIPLLDRARPRADELGHKPTAAAAYYQSAVSVEQVGPASGAEPLYRSALALAQEGHEDLLVGRIAASFALNLGRMQEKFDEAEPWLALAQSTSARLGKPADLDSFSHFAGAIIANARHRPDEATREATYALDIADHGKFDPFRRAEIVNTLGGIALQGGHFEEARTFYTRARDLVTSATGDSHPAAISYDSNLASAAHALGDFPRAVELRKSLVARRIAQLGPEAPRVADDRMTLAFALDANSEGTEAIAEARAAAAVILASKGANTVLGLRGQVRLAQILVGNGAADEAVTIAKRTADQLAQLGPQAVPDRISALAVVADAALQHDRIAEATPLLAEIVAAGGDIEPVALASSMQARLARRAHEPARAVELARRAQKIFVTTSGPGSGDLGVAYLEEGLALAALASPDARAALEHAARLLKGVRWKASADEAAAALAALK